MRYGRYDELVLKIVEIGRELSGEERELVFVRVTGHCGLMGNKLVDDVAKRATLCEQSECASLYKSVKCLWISVLVCNNSKEQEGSARASSPS